MFASNMVFVMVSDGSHIVLWVKMIERRSTDQFMQQYKDIYILWEAPPDPFFLDKRL